MSHGKNFWGQPIWTTFHILSATYKPEHKDAYLCFLNSLRDLLPCETCRLNFKKTLINIPPDSYLSNNNDTFWYSYIIHDAVNKHCTSDSGEIVLKESPRFEEIKHYYFNSLGKDCHQCSLAQKDTKRL